ncbi:MAG: hypothetical protein OXK77_08530 [Gemmatimonadota bacterium]|nr:hypothetical protein [Gemmatimonadota bacterium]MDE2782988.1 hypothetical protein [Gemmatimonadota bacterium]MDE2865088.1 hypothetical protein [Gemmatimonadota bacterium]MXV95327.1 hypothetical protein [Gemmatimonadota bacterium]MYB05147.1 hypothetical protein [Gemmatimonadota bacterium]
MFRPTRERREVDAGLVAWKVRLFAAGAALALAGMGFELRWLVWAGIAALLAGLTLRFLPRRG